MEKLKNFIVKVVNGKPAFKTDYHRALFWKFFAQYEGKEIALAIDPREPKRTLSQNNFYFVYLTMMADQTGHTKEGLHKWAKTNCHPKGIEKEIVFGDEVEIDVSTTTLSKSEFSEYIQNIHEKTGIEPPDPTPFGLPMFEYEYKQMVKEGIIR